ncbi:phospholipase C [Xanthomonas translucens pv. phlei]|uniref:Phospholipase C n=1 Tax=Xanthomonas graminis pv. phlei TaxID=487906 RepID=A0A0K2ZPX8_9XANT|nr:phospholipase C [Xanthomonas translucens pv. phlei]
MPGIAPRNVWLQPSEDGSRLLTPFPLHSARDFRTMRVQGTPHTWPNAQQAWDHGRMGRWAAAKHDHALAHYERDDLPFQFALAEAFTLCDAYHCAIQAGTNPNRVFLWTGQNDPQARAGGPVIANSHDNFPELGGHADDYRWPSYVEALQQAGVSWQIYQDMADNFTDNPLAGFAPFRAAWRGAPGHDPQLRERGVGTRTLAQLRQADTRPFFAALPDVSAAATRAAALHELALPPLPDTVQTPRQAFGVRRSRALPYRPTVQLQHVDARGEVQLRMGNAGAATVLHVYDRYDLAAIPRRYTLGAGATLDATWTTYDGRYDLWLLGANGFHRHYRGDLDAAPLQAEIAQDAHDPQALCLLLRNPGNSTLQVELRPGAYAQAQPHASVTLAPGAEQRRSWSAAPSGGWYDLWLLQDGARQRLAGRVETGKPGVSDPAMGGPARLYQDHPIAIGALG